MDPIAKANSCASDFYSHLTSCIDKAVPIYMNYEKFKVKPL